MTSSKSQLQKQCGRGAIPTNGRRWLFRLVGVLLVPAALLTLVEIGLRVGGYGYATSAFVRKDIQGERCYVNNPSFAWRYLSPGIPLELEPMVFRGQKPPNTRRVFVLGESAAQGTPEPAYAFGRMLEVMLEESRPGTDFEVLIPAIPAINSHAVLDVARECALHEPDLMIAYVGNNEVVGPYGAGTVFSQFINPPRWLIRSSLTVKRLRSAQLLEALLRWRSESKRLRQWRGMEMFVGQEVARDDKRLDRVYPHFRRNLRDICRVAESRGIPLLLCSIPVNLRDCAPFASRHRADLSETALREWQALFHQGLKSEREGLHAQARDAYQHAATLSPDHAEGQFRLARCLDRLGDHVASGEHYCKAREADLLRFRADETVNRIIRQTVEAAKSDSVILVDTEKRLMELSPHGQIGKEFFHEHVHLTFSGNYEVARHLAPAVLAKLPAETEQAIAPPVASLDEATCAQRLAYTEWDQYQISRRLRNDYFAKAPFTSQAYHEARIAEFDARLATLKIHSAPDGLAQAARAYEEALRRRPADPQLHWRYGLLLEERKLPAQAQAQYRWLLDHSGNFSRAMLQLARLYSDGGQLAEAEGLTRRALRCQPYQPHAHYNLGFIHQQQQRPEAAIKAWQRAVDLKPDFGAAYNNLGGALYLAGQVEAAIATLRRGIAEEPGLYDLHYNLGAILVARGDTEAGRQSLKRALEIDPRAAMARRLLETLEQHDGENDVGGGPGD